MRLKAEQLKSHVQRGLAPIYMVAGDVQLLVQEACGIIRQSAREQGFGERLVLHADAGFDWQELLQTTHGLSLFSERRLIELRLPSAKPGDAGSKILQAYAERPVEDNVLLIIAGKIDAASQRSKWFKALESSGVVIQLWPLDARQLPAWILHRMQEKGMQPAPQAVTVLAQRTEGNLLACAQEIERLHLLYGPGPVDVQAIVSAVADNARFDIYALVDSALGGDAVRTTRIVRGLCSEGIEPVLVLWALAREIRLLASMSYEMRQGMPDERVLSQFGVWEKRKAAVRQGLSRHALQGWWHMLRRAGHIDRMIKGVSAGNVWDELLQLSLMMAGVKTLKMV
jgi:DNA polymerase-3 subunit delta